MSLEEFIKTRKNFKQEVIEKLVTYFFINQRISQSIDLYLKLKSENTLDKLTQENSDSLLLCENLSGIHSLIVIIEKDTTIDRHNINDLEKLYLEPKDLIPEYFNILGKTQKILERYEIKSSQRLAELDILTTKIKNNNLIKNLIKEMGI